MLHSLACIEILEHNDVSYLTSSKFSGGTPEVTITRNLNRCVTAISRSTLRPTSVTVPLRSWSFRYHYDPLSSGFNGCYGLPLPCAAMIAIKHSDRLHYYAIHYYMTRKCFSSSLSEQLHWQFLRQICRTPTNLKIMIAELGYCAGI